MDEAESRELFPQRVGERLAAARKAMGLEIDDIAGRTRIAKRQISAIESGDHAALPAPTYSAGFVKAYAQVVGLDAPALARDFRVELGAAPPVRRQVEPYEPADPARIPSRLLAWTALAIAIVIALAYALWRAPDVDVSQLAAGTAPSEETAAPQPAAAPPAAAVLPPPAASGPVTVTALAPVWVRIYEPNGGTKYLDHEMQIGESFTIPATAVDPQLLTGRPQSLEVKVGPQVIPPLGPADKTVADVSLKPQALLARGQNAPAIPAAPTLPPPATVIVPATGAAIVQRSAAPLPQRNRRAQPATAAPATDSGNLPPAFAEPAAPTGDGGAGVGNSTSTP